MYRYWWKRLVEPYLGNLCDSLVSYLSDGPVSFPPDPPRGVGWGGALMGAALRRGHRFDLAYLRGAMITMMETADCT